jgi:hypothetical protein
MGKRRLRRVLGQVEFDGDACGDWDDTFEFRIDTQDWIGLMSSVTMDHGMTFIRIGN